jgi:uracil-DNA glycosylase
MNKIAVANYQRWCWKTYKSKLGIPEGYCYLFGNPVKVHVPLDTACGGIMIIGAYPTAHFNAMGSERDVPIGDHLYPFSSEKYFDGSYVREVDSGREIEELFLKPLNINRSQTWITDLVKLFLFKEGHAKKYERLGFKGTLVDRRQFIPLAKKSVQFINEEINICKPKVIMGLGAEVNSVLLGKSITSATKVIELGEKQKYIIADAEYDYYACPHPGILMRESELGSKWKDVLVKTLEEIKVLVC